MRAAEEILNKHYYTRQDLISVINESRKELLQECIEIAHEQGILGYPEFIESQLKKLLEQIK